MATKKKSTKKPELTNSQLISGLAILSMLFGIIALLFFWVVFVGLILGILAFILGFLTIRVGSNRNISFVGIVAGLVAIIMNLVMVFFFVSGVMSYSIVTNPNPQVTTQKN